MTDGIGGIEAQWTMAQEGNEGDEDSLRANVDHSGLTAAVEQCEPAIRQCLLDSLGDEEAADEVFREFSLRLVRGDFGHADGSAGKFRSFIESILCDLVADQEEGIDKFLLAWRQALLDKSWSRLEAIEKTTGNLVFTILRARIDHPGLSTVQLQEYLAINSKKVVPPLKTFRLCLHRARRKFADCLLDLVASSLIEVNRDTVEEELIELGLHHYCVSALANRFSEMVPDEFLNGC